jgi:tRNA A-37 threonylcarbamoyl transferase component Bud32
MQICANCQTANQDISRFCFRCGQPLVAAPTSAGGSVLAPNMLLRGRYLVLQKLAEGGMGAVYLVEDKQLFGRRCVVKEMLPYYSTPAEQQEAENKFRREAELLANLNHPGIPQVYEYFIEQNRYYLVMQFVEGENLEDRLQRLGGPLTEMEVLAYARQLTSVLAYIANVNPPVIHRDIKPANIILEQVTGQVKLVDFGIAKAQKASGSTQTSPMGTIGYAPPEQHQGRTDPRTDVYALGATLHHLVTGRDPTDPQQAPIPFDYPPARQLLPSLSAEIEALLIRMVEKDIKRRPTAAQLKAELDAFGQGSRATAAAPFVFRSGATIQMPQELGSVCDQHWTDGIFHLYQGHFETWLQSVNRHDLATRAAAIRQRSQDRDAGLEEFIRAVMPTMPLPVLQLDLPQLDFGVVERGDRAMAELVASNGGRGYVYGDIKPLVNWVRLSHTRLACRAGEQQPIVVTIDTAQLNEGANNLAILEINSNGGQQRVAAQMVITWQPKLEVQPARLDFGEVLLEEHGKQVSTVLTITNSGGGVLNGHLPVAIPWLTFSQDSFQLPSGQSVQITVHADTTQVPALRSQATALPITWENKNTAVPAHIGIKKSWYDPAARASRWLAYGALLLVALGSWAYALGFLGWNLLRLHTPTAEALVWPAVALLLPFPLLLFAGRLIPQLDEIESYYYPGDLVQNTPALVFASMPRLLVGLALFLPALAVGGAAGVRLENSLFSWPAALGALAGGLGWVALMQGGLRWLRPFLAGLAGSFLGVLLVGSSQQSAILWAAGGLLVGLVFEPEGLPLRLRWALAHAARPVLAAVLTVAGLLLGQALLSRIVISPFAFFASADRTGLGNLFWLIVVTAIGLVWAGLALWAGLPAGQFARRPLQTALFFSLPLIAAGLIAYAIGWFFFSLVNIGASSTWGPGVFLVVAGAVSVVAWLYLQPGHELWRQPLAAGRWLQTQAQQQVPSAATRASQWAGRLSAATTSAGIEPALAATVTAGVLVLMPFLARIAGGLLLLLLCAGIPLLFLGGLAYYLIRQNRP